MIQYLNKIWVSECGSRGDEQIDLCDKRWRGSSGGWARSSRLAECAWITPSCTRIWPTIRATTVLPPKGTEVDYLYPET